jgi:O-antigen/teichoic acid export membrane protein
VSDVSLESPKAASSLRSLALRGSAWTIVGYGASQILRLAGNLILTRVLFPEAFGLSALIGVFMAGLAMFSDVGIGPSIIRSQRHNDDDFLNTAWTIQVVRGLVLWIASMILAWPLAYFYKEPQLVRLVPIAGLSALITGFGSTSLFTAARGLAVGRLIILELITQIVTLAAMSIYALLSPTVWSLVVGGLVGFLVRTILSHTSLPGTPNRFVWERRATREISVLARWILVNSAITFLAMQLDRLLLGKLISLRELGLYSLAAGLAQIPRDVVGRLSNSIVFPTLSRILQHSEAAAQKVRTMHRALLLVASLISGVLIAAGPLIIRILYDDRYRGAGTILSLLAVGTWIQVFTASYYSIILAAGKPSYNGAGMTTRLAIIALLAAPTFHWLGVPGIAALTSLSEIGVAGFCFYGAYRLGLSFPWLDLQAVALTSAVFVASHLVFSMVT